MVCACRLQSRAFAIFWDGSFAGTDRVLKPWKGLQAEVPGYQA